MKKLTFSLELENSDKLASQFSRIELDLLDISSNLKQVKKDIDIFNNGTDEQRAALEASGKSINNLTSQYKQLRTTQISLQEERKGLNREIRDQAKAFQQVANEIPKDSLIGLRQTYKDLRKEINLMDEAARSSAQGLQKIAQANSVKKQIDDIGESVRDFRSQVGSYRKAVEDVFKLFKSNGSGGGSGISGIVDPLANILGGGNPIDAFTDLTALLGPFGAAASVAVGATGALVNEISKISKEYEILNNQVGTLTSLTGEDLKEATVGVKTLSEVFNQDFNEVLRAANTLTKELTGDFGTSLQLIEKGFIGGANASGDFLDSIQEYSTQIRAAGASGEEFIEILIRSQREGIFSDKGVDLVKEFGLRIREQTTATTKALTDAFGKTFTTDLFDQINKGSLNSVQALVKVSDQLKKGDLTAKQSAQLLADVFGGPGEDAGLRFIKILSEVDGNLDKLIDRSDAYTIRQYNLLEATNELNTQQQILAAQFAGLGSSFDTITIKAKAAAIEFFNFNTIGLRAANKAIQEDGLFSFVKDFFTEGGLSDEVAEIIKADADALRQINDREKELAEQRRARAVEGKASLAELRIEQTKLKNEIDNTNESAAGYNKLLDDYNTITKNIATSTKNLNGNIRKTKGAFKEVLTEGSIEALSKIVSDLNKQISKASPNETLKLVEDLSEAELDLSKAKKEIEDFKEEIRLANIDSLDIDDQVVIRQDLIEREFELEEQATRLRVQNEKDLQRELVQLRLDTDVLLLQEELKRLDKLSTEYVRVQNEIADKTKQIAQNTSANLFEDRATQLGNDELNALTAIIPNVEDLDASAVLKALTDFEQARTDIQTDFAIQRLELEKERLISLGEDTLAIDNEIAEKKLAQIKTSNDRELELQKKKIAAQQKAEKDNAKLLGDIIGDVGGFVEDALKGNLESVEDFNKALLKLLIDSLEAYLVASVTAQALAQPDSVATFGLTGAARAAVLAALVKAAFGIAKAAILEDGAILSHGGLSDGHIVNGPSHRNGGVKFRVKGDNRTHEYEGGEAVIKKTSTSKWKGLLSAINQDGGGRSFGGDSKYWNEVLNSFRVPQYMDGAILNGTAPQILSPNTVISVARIAPSDIEALGASIIESQEESLRPLIEDIVNQVVIGLDTSTRMKERQEQSRQNSLI